LVTGNVILCCGKLGLKKYIIRKRATGQYVDRSQRLPEDPAQAMVFDSVEEADFYRVQLKNSPDQYEICELTAEGKLVAVRDSGSG
jgi:hypothetical protein